MTVKGHSTPSCTSTVGKRLLTPYLQTHPVSFTPSSRFMIYLLSERMTSVFDILCRCLTSTRGSSLSSSLPRKLGRGETKYDTVYNILYYRIYNNRDHHRRQILSRGVIVVNELQESKVLQKNVPMYSKDFNLEYSVFKEQ